MRPTHSAHTSGEQPTTDDGQPLVANGELESRARNNDTTADPLADDGHVTKGGSIDAPAIKTTATRHVPLNDEIPIIPERLAALTDDGHAGKKQAMRLYDGQRPQADQFDADMARRHGETLSQWEERVGQILAGMDVTGRAGSGHEATGRAREEANRQAVADMCACSTHHDKTHETPWNPFRTLTSNERERIIQEATRLSDKYGHMVASERRCIKVLCRFVRSYNGFIQGVHHGRNYLLKDTPTTLADIDPNDEHDTDAVVVITHIKPDPNRKKEIAASICGADGENGHLTLWKKSKWGTFDTVDSLWLNTDYNGDASTLETAGLAEGAKVKIEDAEVSEHKGEVSLALTSDSSLTIIDDGDGRPAKEQPTYDGHTEQNPRRCTGAGVRSQTNVDNAKMT